MASKVDQQRGGSDKPKLSNLRILFVTLNLPVPVLGGSAQRTNLIIGALRKLGTVDLFITGGDRARTYLVAEGFPVAGSADIDDVPLFRFFEYFGGRFAQSLKVIVLALFPKSFRYNPVPACSSEVQRIFIEGNYDIIVGRYLGPSSRAGVHLLRPSIVDVDDLDSQKIRSWIDQLGYRALIGLLAGIYLRRVERIESKMLRRITRVWVSAEEDQRAIGPDRADIIPNIPFSAGEALGASPARGPILFVGSLDYRINVNAVSRFLAAVWPALLSRKPNLQLRIVGGGLDDRTRSAWMRITGVEVVGFVADLREEYGRCCFSIIPIWEGGGTKIKLLESLSFQRTCIVARPSLRGYSNVLKDSESVAVVNNNDEFSDRVIELFENVTLRHAMEIKGRLGVSQQFTHESLKLRIRDSVMSVLAQDRGSGPEVRRS